MTLAMISSPTCVVDIGDQYGVNYVIDNNNKFVANVGDTARKNWEQLVACINDMTDNDSFKKRPSEVPWHHRFDDK
jgi:hypothetical protein